MTSSRKKPNTKLSLDDYLEFFDNRNLDLQVAQLRQIISMHGFFKKFKTHKSILVEAISTMDLMDLRRSTLLNEGVSRNHYTCFLTLEEVINDLKELNWQECHITSLLDIGGVVSASSTTTTTSDVFVSGWMVKKPRKKLRCRRKFEVGVEDHSETTTAGTIVAAGSTTSAQYEEAEGQNSGRLGVLEKLQPRRVGQKPYRGTDYAL